MQTQKEAERGYRRFAGVSPEWAWKFKVLEAKSLLWQGNNPAVLRLLDSANLSSVPIEGTVSILTLKGIAHARELNLPLATRELEDAKHLCSREAGSCGEVFQGCGLFALGQNHFSEAQHYLEQSLSLARITGDRFLESSSLLNLISVLEKEDRFDEALDRSASTVDAATRIGAADIALAAQENIGWAYYRLGDSERALGGFLDAEKRAEQLGDIFAQDNALTNIGYVLMDAHQFDVAEQKLQRALTLAKDRDSKESMYNALRGLALAEVQNGNLNDASHHAELALEIARKSDLDQIYPVLVQGQIAARRGDALQAEQTFRSIELNSTSPTYLKWEAQHSLARLYEEQKTPDVVDKQYRAALATLGSTRDSIQREDLQISFLANGSRIYDDYIHFLITRGKIADALRWADYSRARTLAEGLGRLPRGASHEPPLLQAQQIAARIQSTVLFYWLGERSSYVWVVTPKQVHLISLPAAAEIETLAERYNKALGGPQDVLDSANEDGRTLYRILIAPASKLLPRNGKVVIIPDGKLNTLNFETLLVSEPKLHYWIEDATITNASSLRVLDRPRTARTVSAPQLLLVGNVVSPNSDYPELAYSANEMESVKRHFPVSQQHVLQRDQATASAYLGGAPEQFSTIHFVAHATASRLSPLDSAIILSRGGGDNDAFKLYARDIIQHPLRADLVTISSCFSAGTRAYSGEGLVGLSWAFLHAGAHNVVAALWEATDGSTAQIMDEFYDRLSKGEHPDTALRSAKLSLLHSPGAFRKAFYWGPFQLYAGS